MEIDHERIDHLPVIVEFSGGLEILFSNIRKHTLSVPKVQKNGKPVNIAFLVHYLCDNLMRDPRKEMFVLDGTVYVNLNEVNPFDGNPVCRRRPGILVLINDADWELDGGEQYEIQHNDNIFFVSTLHGG
ncbi:uncharacterized protein KY384_003688 [Bacidia gigantensis]|uniref:uncharacterized protein n=1 Tax=Bacidia gigantensis TaxID=2732470 RepID=UPI001D053E35|nr:uncharacterized protein KY384_003688 [Bacidia gigantensis]KAG8532051.1 hypothetical protein KY384_003688 [Bacidia gigantensis]